MLFLIPMFNVEAILFDLDGTLVDSHPGIENAVLSAIDLLLPNVEHRFSKHLIGPPIKEIFSQSLNCPTEETLSMLEKAYREIYDRQSCLQSIPYPGVAETLSQLVNSGLQAFIVTNKPTLPTTQILEFLKLSHFFVEAISPDAICPHFSSKTAASNYLIQKHNLNPARTVFVGDSEDDARAASVCGLASFIAVSYGYGKAYLEAEHKISAFPDILKVLPSMTAKS